MGTETAIGNLERKMFAGFWIRALALLIDVSIVGLVTSLFALGYNAVFGQTFFVKPVFALMFTRDDEISKIFVVNAHEQQGELAHSEHQEWLYGIIKTQHNDVWSFKAQIEPGQTTNKQFSWPKGWPVNEEKVKEVILSRKLPGTTEDMIADLKAIGADELAKGMVTTQYLELALLFIYIVAFEGSRFKGSLGKRLLKLGVVNDAGNRIGYGAAALRNIGKVVSTIILLAGFLMVIWTQKRQGLHDKFVGSLVVRKMALTQIQSDPTPKTD